MSPADFVQPGSSRRSHVAAIGPREKSRRQIVMLGTLGYLLLIFEGALRKWVLTSFGAALFFIRDPFVLAVYWLAFRHAMIPRHNLLLRVGAVFACIGLFLIAAQAAGVASHIEQWPLLAAYGWRNYFFLLSLAVLT